MMTKTIDSSRRLRAEEWTDLSLGDRVVIQRSGESVSTGQIDDISKDAKVFWVSLDQGCGRILVHEGDKPMVELLHPCSA
jgi:hypothetical protein